MFFGKETPIKQYRFLILFFMVYLFFWIQEKQKVCSNVAKNNMSSKLKYLMTNWVISKSHSLVESTYI